MKPEVIMYTMPLCPGCIRAKRFLSDKGIQFTEKSILNPQNLKERLKISSRPGSHVTIVGERILILFSPGELKEVFNNF